MKKVTVISRPIPTKPRSDNYPTGSSVVRTGGSSGGNTTVVTGGAALEAEVISNVDKTGNIETGKVLPKGMTFTQFVQALLHKLTPATLVGRISTANDVEYGSAKGFLTYTASRNSSGEMMSAYYDNKVENILEFTTEVGGVQTTERRLTGNYTENETYKATVVYAASEDSSIPETVLNNTISVNVRRKWFAGVVSAVPANSDQVRALAGSGLYSGAGTYKFNAGQWKMIAICIPEGAIKEITVTAYPGNFIEDTGVCSGPTTISVKGANNSTAINYKMWIIQAETPNDADTFTFKTN